MAEIIDTSSFDNRDQYRHEDGLVEIKLTSKNGNEYGTRVPEGSDGENIKSQLSAATSSDLETTSVWFPIYWEPGREWQSTDDDFRNKTGIMGWQIRRGQYWPFEYTLWIHGNRMQAYLFQDQTGDAYSLTNFNTSIDHSVSYNSSGPILIRCYLV